jgi:hypothetical protein
MGIDPTVVAGLPLGGEQMADDADRSQRAELARRLEAALVKLDELRAEIEDIALDVEGGP